MIKLGCHLSSSGGFLAMGETAKSIGGNTFQFFTRNPRGGGKSKLFDPYRDENGEIVDIGDAGNLLDSDITRYLKFARENDFGEIVAHAPYTMNLCSKDDSISGHSLEMLIDDLLGMDLLPGSIYNFHPGSHVSQGTEVGIEKISKALNTALPFCKHTTVCLETMAGKGSEVGGNLEELRQIIDSVDENEKLGICLDTCHIFDGGYDIVNDAERYLENFDRIIGIDRLKAVHVNDSKFGLSSHKDRHEKIGLGQIGLDGMVKFLSHDAFKNLPMILETPNELDGYKNEIALLRGKLENEAF